jgi:DNA repair protein RecO (recombination protein O)
MKSDKETVTEGIVLQVTPYKEYDKIITIFTPLHGLLKIFVKGKKSHHLPFTIPFARGEYIYNAGRALPQLIDASLISSSDHLRNSLESLEISAKIQWALLKTQLQGKPAPKLYTLFSLFLEKIPLSLSLYGSFLLKILKHEGAWQKELKCSICNKILKETWRSRGECFCKKDMPKAALYFSEEEEKMIFFLMESRSLSTIASFSFEKSLILKIETLFESALTIVDFT